MQERRIFDRIEAPLRIKYTIIEKSPHSKKANAKDISGGGIRLALEEKLTLGTNLKLDIALPGEKNKVTVTYGKVVWTRMIEILGPNPASYYETGIQFTKIDPLSIGRIIKYFSEKK